MAEISRFWDCDAVPAEPYIYDSDEFAETRRGRWRPGVLLGKLNECAVTATGAKSVYVATGEAIIRGVWYRNNAQKTISIPDHAGVSRTDRIILRYTLATRTIEAVRLAGAEGSTAPAALTETANVYEISLAIIYVTNVDLGNSDIAEDRVFAQPFARTIQQNVNLVTNGHAPEGLTTFWTTSNLALTSTDAQQHWGEYCFSAACTVANGYAQFTVPIEKMVAGRPHYIRVWVWAVSGTVRLDIAGCAREFPVEKTSAAASWVLLQGTFVPSVGTDVDIRIMGVEIDAEFYFDAVLCLMGGSYDLYIPAPETAALGYYDHQHCGRTGCDWATCGTQWGSPSMWKSATDVACLPNASISRARVWCYVAGAVPPADGDALAASGAWYYLYVGQMYHSHPIGLPDGPCPDDGTEPC